MWPTNHVLLSHLDWSEPDPPPSRESRAVLAQAPYCESRPPFHSSSFRQASNCIFFATHRQTIHLFFLGYHHIQTLPFEPPLPKHPFQRPGVLTKYSVWKKARQKQSGQNARFDNPHEKTATHTCPQAKTTQIDRVCPLWCPMQVHRCEYWRPQSPVVFPDSAHILQQKHHPPKWKTHTAIRPKW